jgi:hypothetical protein
MELIKGIEERRSVNFFDSSYKMSKEDSPSLPS